MINQFINDFRICEITVLRRQVEVVEALMEKSEIISGSLLK